jgi:3D (Asp-Asp-Asp) domain-containing protein
MALLAAALVGVGAGATALASSQGGSGDKQLAHPARAQAAAAEIAADAGRVSQEFAAGGRFFSLSAPVQHVQHVDALAHGSGSQSRCRRAAPPVAEHRITHRQWLSGVVITEYYPAPERWFTGRKVKAPGLPGRHAVDWLYSARGLAMEGDGVDMTGHPAHIDRLGSTGWVNYDGHATVPVCLGKWSDGPPVWLKGGWRNAHGQVTFPLASGGWANRPGGRVLDYGGVTFASGSSLPLRYYHSVAVDPGLIPLGSRVFIPAYRHLGGGWFIAQDTGGAIRGRHIDVYRSAPASPDDLGRYMTGQRVLVIPPG